MSNARKLIDRRQTIGNVVTSVESQRHLVSQFARTTGDKSENYNVISGQQNYSINITNLDNNSNNKYNKSPQATRILARRNSSNSSVDSASSEFFSRLAALQLSEEQESFSRTRRHPQQELSRFGGADQSNGRHTRHLLARFHLWRSRSESRRASSASGSSTIDSNISLRDTMTGEQLVESRQEQQPTNCDRLHMSDNELGLQAENAPIQTNCLTQQPQLQQLDPQLALPSNQRQRNISFLGEDDNNHSEGAPGTASPTGGLASHRNNQQQIESPTLTATNTNATTITMSPSSLSSMSPLTGDAASERRLWQSFVMPLVLGCVIFLVAIWTRQVSLALSNDTIIMIMILAAVFIVMSGVAFWLSYDQQLEEAIQSGGQANQLTYCQHHAINGLERPTTPSGHNHHNNHHQHHRHHPNHDHSNYNDNNHNHNHMATGDPQLGHLVTIDGHKCCAQLLDCLPPDYYSAMRNSLPVNLFYTNSSGDFPLSKSSDASAYKLTTTKVFLGQEFDQLSDIQSLSNFSLPPSYDELSLAIDMPVDDMISNCYVSPQEDEQRADGSGTSGSSGGGGGSTSTSNR